jgi:adenylate kinase family enzyme
VPSEITIELIKKAIDANPRCKFFLIDGFPRNIEQGDMFERDIVPCRFLLNLDCSEKVMEERINHRLQEQLAKGLPLRPDDNLETMRKRFQTHVTTCVPVLAHYEKKGKLRQVDASKGVEEVYSQIKRFFAESSAGSPQ